MNENLNRFEPLKSKSAFNKGDIYDGKYHDIICKVVYIYDWKKSKGDDYMMTILVTDTSSRKLFLKIFNSEPRQMEIKINDNVIVKNVKFFKDDLFLVKNPVQIDLIDSQPSNMLSKREAVEIKDISLSKYINFSGFVIHKQRELHNLAMLFMIDYTRNSRIPHRVNRGKYSNDMIIHVKIWDDHIAIFDKIIVGGCYKLENLKVYIEEGSIYGNLSNIEGSRIERIMDQEIINIFENRKKLYCDKPSKFYDKIYKRIDSINSEGFHKIKIKILGHTPMKGFDVEVCKKCLVSSVDINYEICKCQDNNKAKLKVLKLLGEDDSAKQIFICKNNICQLAIERLAMKQEYWECLVFTKEKKEGTVYEIRDII